MAAAYEISPQSLSRLLQAIQIKGVVGMNGKPPTFTGEEEKVFVEHLQALWIE